LALVNLKKEKKRKKEEKIIIIKYSFVLFCFSFEIFIWGQWIDEDGGSEKEGNLEKKKIKTKNMTYHFW